MGKFTILNKCIKCHACTRIAEDNFMMEEHSAVIIKQPSIDYEYEECIAAMRACPIQAIKQELR